MMENLSERERKLVIALVPALLVTAITYYMTEPASTEVAAVVDTNAAIEVARQRLERARAISAQLPAKQDLRKTLDTNLAAIEKRLITADTPAQAQAQLNQIFRRVARVQGSTIEIRNIDIGTVQPVDQYSEIVLNIAFDCRVEGLVNLLTDLSSQPEFLTWRDIRISSQDTKQKRINVSMTLVGIGPSKLLARPATQSGGRG